MYRSFGFGLRQVQGICKCSGRHVLGVCLQNVDACHDLCRMLFCARSGLLAGWASAVDPTSGNTYYYKGDVMQWTKPTKDPPETEDEDEEDCRVAVLDMGFDSVKVGFAQDDRPKVMQKLGVRSLSSAGSSISTSSLISL